MIATACIIVAIVLTLLALICIIAGWGKETDHERKDR